MARNGWEWETTKLHFETDIEFRRTGELVQIKMDDTIIQIFHHLSMHTFLIK